MVIVAGCFNCAAVTWETPLSAWAHAHFDGFPHTTPLPRGAARGWPLTEVMRSLERIRATFRARPDAIAVDRFLELGRPVDDVRTLRYSAEAERRPLTFVHIAWAGSVRARLWEFDAALVKEGGPQGPPHEIQALAELEQALRHRLRDWGGSRGRRGTIRAHSTLLQPWRIPHDPRSWEVRDSQRRGLPHLLVVPCLVLTFLFGPAGLVLYLALRGTRRAVFVDDDETAAR